MASGGGKHGDSNSDLYERLALSMFSLRYEMLMYQVVLALVLLVALCAGASSAPIGYDVIPAEIVINGIKAGRPVDLNGAFIDGDLNISTGNRRSTW